MPMIPALLLCVPAILAQLPPDAGAPPPAFPGRSEVALAPSRLELSMKPGSSQTVVVHAVSSGGAESEVRLLASLGDWSMNAKGEMEFAKPGSNPRSASDWIIYTPVEFTVKGGEAYPIRVTIDVPEDAAPGDHTAALFVEERPPNIKTRTNEKQIIFHFRLAAIIYVMVTPYTQQGALVGLDVSSDGASTVITSTLKNDGNAHIRPSHSWEIADKAGQVVASAEPVDAMPVLGNATLQPQIKVDKALPPGEYAVRYRVDFKDGTGKLVEGRKTFVVAAPEPPKKETRKR